MSDQRLTCPAHEPHFGNKNSYPVLALLAPPASAKSLSHSFHGLDRTKAGKEKLMNELGNEVKKHPKWQRTLKEGNIELIKLLFPPVGILLEMARVYLEDE